MFSPTFENVYLEEQEHQTASKSEVQTYQNTMLTSPRPTRRWKQCKNFCGGLNSLRYDTKGLGIADDVKNFSNFKAWGLQHRLYDRSSEMKKKSQFRCA